MLKNPRPKPFGLGRGFCAVLFKKKINFKKLLTYEKKCDIILTRTKYAGIARPRLVQAYVRIRNKLRATSHSLRIIKIKYAGISKRS